MERITRKKIKNIGSELYWASKEAVKMTAPIYPGIALQYAGQPEIGSAVYVGTVPWVAGYTAYHYYKARKLRKGKTK